MRNKIRLITAVWGDRYIDSFFRYTIPSLLAPGNIPAICNDWQVEYVILTNFNSYFKLLNNQNLVFLKKFVRLRIKIVHFKNSKLKFQKHIEIFRNEMEIARTDNCYVGYIPPDIIWNNKCLSFLVNVIKEKRVAVAVPHLRVVEEKIQNTIFQNDYFIDIESTDLVKIGYDFIHPLSAAIVVGNSHHRVSHEVLFYIPDEGFILRQLAREITFFDPRNIELSTIWYPSDSTDLKEVYIVNSSDDIFFLSVHPEQSDLELLRFNSPISPLTLLEQAIHPLNCIKLIPLFSKANIRLYFSKTQYRSEQKWKDAEVLADIFMNDFIQKYNEIYNIYLNDNNLDEIKSIFYNNIFNELYNFKKA